MTLNRINDDRLSIYSASSQKLPFELDEIPYTVSLKLIESLDIVDLDNVVRCLKCKSYLNPYCEIIPPGYQWTCNICMNKNISDVNISKGHPMFGNRSIVFPAPPEYVLKAPRQGLTCLIVEDSSEVNSAVEKIIFKLERVILIVFNGSGVYILGKDLMCVSTYMAPEFIIEDAMFCGMPFDVPESTEPSGSQFRNALKTAEKLLSVHGGSIVFFQTSDSKQDNMEKVAERLMLLGISFNLFSVPDGEVKLDRILVIPKLTGGLAYFSPNFVDDEYHRSKIEQFFERIDRCYKECICRIRPSKNLSITSISGAFLRRRDDILFISAYYDSLITVELSYSDSNEFSFLQSAMLFTHKKKKMISVINIEIPCGKFGVDDIDPFQCLAGLYLKYRRSDIRKQIERRTQVPILKTLGNALLQTVPIRAGGSTPTDYRSYFDFLLEVSPFFRRNAILYPILVNFEQNRILPLTLQSLETTGFYLLYTGTHIYMFIAVESNLDFEKLLGNITPGKLCLKDVSTEENRKLLDLVSIIDSSADTILVDDRVESDVDNIYKKIFFSYMYDDNIH